MEETIVKSVVIHAPVKIVLSGTVLLALGWDAGIDSENDPTWEHIARAFDCGKRVKRGKGYSKEFILAHDLVPTLKKHIQSVGEYYSGMSEDDDIRAWGRAMLKNAERIPG